MTANKYNVEHLGAVREAIGKQLIPTLYHPQQATYASPEEYLRVEQILALYVAAYFLSEVVDELRGGAFTVTDGRGAPLQGMR